MDVEHERAELLEAVRNLAFLFERTGDLPKIYECIGQLNTLRAKLVALGPVVKTAK
jgi:hypothetical protein